MSCSASPGVAILQQEACVAEMKIGHAVAIGGQGKAEILIELL